MNFFKDNKRKFTKKTNQLISNSVAATLPDLSKDTDLPPQQQQQQQQQQQHEEAESLDPESLQKQKQNSFIINTSGLDDINKRIMANFMGLSNDYADLGSQLNSFSLMFSETIHLRHEGNGNYNNSRKSHNNNNNNNNNDDNGNGGVGGVGGKGLNSSSKNDNSNGGTGAGADNDDLGSNDNDDDLNYILDKVGQAFDRSYITINSMIGELETQFSEPLGEAVQYTEVLHHVTKYQLKKLKQKQMLESELKSKRKELDDLLKIEGDAGNTNILTHSEDRNGGGKSPEFAFPKEQGKNGVDANGSLVNSVSRATNNKNDDNVNVNPNANVNVNGSKNSTATSSSRFKLPSLKKLTQYVSEIIDQNPQQTRKTKIYELSDKIHIFERCQEIMLADLSYIFDEVDKNLRAFHARQLRTIYGILVYYNRVMIYWARKNTEIWEEIKDEIKRF